MVRSPHISLQQVVHAGLSHVLWLMKLLQGLSNLLVWNLALPLLLVVVIQTTAFELLQMVLNLWKTQFSSFVRKENLIFLHIIRLMNIRWGVLQQLKYHNLKNASNEKTLYGKRVRACISLRSLSHNPCNGSMKFCFTSMSRESFTSANLFMASPTSTRAPPESQRQSLEVQGQFSVFRY